MKQLRGIVAQDTLAINVADRGVVDAGALHRGEVKRGAAERRQFSITKTLPGAFGLMIGEGTCQPMRYTVKAKSIASEENRIAFRILDDRSVIALLPSS